MNSSPFYVTKYIFLCKKPFVAIIAIFAYFDQRVTQFVCFPLIRFLKTFSMLESTFFCVGDS